MYTPNIKMYDKSFTCNAHASFLEITKEQWPLHIPIITFLELGQKWKEKHMCFYFCFCTFPLYIFLTRGRAPAMVGEFRECNLHYINSLTCQTFLEYRVVHRSFYYLAFSFCFSLSYVNGWHPLEAFSKQSAHVLNSDNQWKDSKG